MESYIAWFRDYCADGQFYQRIVHNIITCFVKPGHVVVAGGACCGRFTLPLCEQVGTQGRVYAIEPITALAAELGLSTLPQLRVVEAVAADFDGNTNFYHFRNAPASSSLLPDAIPFDAAIDVVEVPACTLDALIPEEDEVRFIKLGVEGAEFAALRGARRILETSQPLIVFECDPQARWLREGDSQLRSFFDSLGYVVVDLFGRPAAPRRRRGDHAVPLFVAGADRESRELIDNLQIAFLLAAQQQPQRPNNG